METLTQGAEIMIKPHQNFGLRILASTLALAALASNTLASAATILTDTATSGAEYVVGIDDLAVAEIIVDVRFRFGTYSSLTGIGLSLLPLTGDEDAARAMRSAINAAINDRVPILLAVGEPGANASGLVADGYWNSYAVAFETETSLISGLYSAGTDKWVDGAQNDVDSFDTFIATFSNVRSGLVFQDGFEALPFNQLVNAGFEAFSAGTNPPFDPPDSWASFGTEVPPAAVGYDQYATQAHGAPIYNPLNPGDQSNSFPGYEDSRALKMWGRGRLADVNDLKQTLGTIYQEFPAAVVPVGSNLTLSGWAYVSSVDPLGSDNNVYLVIKCFASDFSAEYCGGGAGRKSPLITDETAMDTWIEFSVTVESLDAEATVVQAGLEFEQCASGSCTYEEAKGAVFWDEIYFSWE
jgi:hypothetical protein